MSYRLPTTELVLPHSFEEIKFPVNRIADNLTFNKKIHLIDNNFNKLLEYCNVVDNNIPTTYETIYYLESDKLKPTNILNQPSLPNHDYKHIEIVEKYNGDKIIICSTDSKIDFYIGKLNSVENLLLNISYDTIKQIGSLTFRDISYIKVNGEKLYVYDSELQSIVTYNILALISEDNCIIDQKLINQFFKIKELKAFDFNTTNIWGILDNKVIKFNQDFNVKQTYGIDNGAIDIKTYNDEMYILYSDHIKKYSLLNLSEYVVINLEKIDDDEFVSIDLSIKNENCLYVLSNKYIYKYLKSGDIIGYFNADTGGKNYNDFALLGQDDEDYILSLDQNKIHFFKNKLTTFTIYDDINLLDREYISDLKINSLELEQDFVYNAVLQKLVYNNMLLYNSLIYKIYIETDVNGLLLFKNKENLINDESLHRDDIFYGQNEVFSFQTFNRSFKYIYSIQEKILKLIEFEVIEKYSNTLII